MARFSFVKSLSSQLEKFSTETDRRTKLKSTSFKKFDKLVALLSLSSCCLVIVVWLFLAKPWVCLQFVIVVFPDYTHLLFLSLFILVCLVKNSLQSPLWSLFINNPYIQTGLWGTFWVNDYVLMFVNEL